MLENGEWFTLQNVAILLTIFFCSSILAVNEKSDANICLLLSIIGHYSLFPLLFPRNLLYVKLLLFLVHMIVLYCTFTRIYNINDHSRIVTRFESLYISGFILLFLFENYIDFYITKFQTRLPFLPLLLTSLYCSVGVIYCFVKYYIHFLTINIKVTYLK